ncbi:MAG TPA: sigma-70 family RNA polymerase sigma factor [Cytophagales bacterium]|nr:sigma-70 family RNA polymerase sigma factor [Cytophagales bacterium]
MEIEEKEFSDKAKQDFKLVQRAKQNDQKAFAELMKRYRKSVYHLILKMVRNPEDAEDLTSEAFSRAFKNLARFNPEFTFSTWLFRIATNNCIDFLRKKKLSTMSIDGTFKDDNGDDVGIDIKDGNLDPEDESIKLEKIEIVQGLVSKLPPKYQTLVRMRYFEELSYEEIAVELDAPLGTVKAQLHRARELLYDMIKNKKDVI